MVGLKWSGVEWSGVERSGVWSGEEGGGVEWKWRGKEWSGGPKVLGKAVSDSPRDGAQGYGVAGRVPTGVVKFLPTQASVDQIWRGV